MTKRKTRFERIVPSARKPRKVYDPEAWLRQARSFYQYPFETMKVIESTETEEGEQTYSMKREFHPHEVPNILKIAMEHGLQQAYLTGVAEGVRQIELLQFMVKYYAPKNQRLQKEVSAFLATLKKDIASGKKHV